MKRFICLILCLLTLAAMFSGCAKKPAPTDDKSANVPSLTEAEVAGIHYCGLATRPVTADRLAAAVGVDAASVIATTTAAGEELLVVNDVTYKTVLYKQLQCINYKDKSVITLTYILDDEELQGALDGIVNTLEEPFGAPSVSESSAGYSNYTWRDASVNDNYILLYPLNDTELKLSFYLF